MKGKSRDLSIEEINNKSILISRQYNITLGTYTLP